MLRYTFNPPEEELINYYLNNKITEKNDPEGKQINEVNICHYEPVDLPGLAKIESSHTWYFISPVEKFGRLNRTKRASRSGHWKITGNSRTVKDVDGNPIGLKNFLVFQENKRSSTSSTSTTTHQHKTKWIIHEFHSFLHHPNKDTFVLCKLMKKTRTSRSGAVVDVLSPAAIDLPLTSDPFLNHSQVVRSLLQVVQIEKMPTEYNNVVEDDGRDYCNDLEELLPEFHTIDWLDYRQFDHWESFTDITQSLEGGESSGLLLGEKGHVYGPNTTENSNHLELGECEAVVGQVMFPPNSKNDQI